MVCRPSPASRWFYPTWLPWIFLGWSALTLSLRNLNLLATLVWKQVDQEEVHLQLYNR